MKISNALFLAGTAIGLPVFFVDFSAIPLAVQIAWALVIVGCGIAGGAVWAHENG
jgi:hypothetical protein